jgi:hypothetical protein
VAENQSSFTSVGSSVAYRPPDEMHDGCTLAVRHLRSAERTRHRVRRNRRIQINVSAFTSPPREVRYEPVMKTRLLA